MSDGPDLTQEQHDRLIAGVDLVGRAGARDFEMGYLHEDAPIEEADWWAHANYGGNRIIVEHLPGPIEATEALAERILTGAKCKCGRLVALSDHGAMFLADKPDEAVPMADGSTWTAQQAREAGQCRWRRKGAKWIGACGVGSGPSRAERRKRK